MQKRFAALAGLGLIAAILAGCPRDDRIDDPPPPVVEPAPVPPPVDPIMPPDTPLVTDTPLVRDTL